MTSLELTDIERDLFISWLQQREKSIREEMELLKNLHVKLTRKNEVSKIPSENRTRYLEKHVTALPEADDSSSWVNTIKKALEHFEKPVPSGEIVKRLLEKSSLASKGRRFVTKAVTSKLWLLQERGEVIKSRDNGRYVYALKK